MASPSNPYGPRRQTAAFRESDKPDAQLLTVDQLRKLFPAKDGEQLAKRTIERWVADGCPVARLQKLAKGSRYLFDLDHVRGWYEQRFGANAEKKESLVAAQARLNATKADIAEIELAEKRGEMVSLKEVIRILSDLFNLLQRGIMSVPAKFPRFNSVERAEAEDFFRRELETLVINAIRRLPHLDPAEIESLLGGGESPPGADPAEAPAPLGMGGQEPQPLA
ncbi:MAG: hypothetical protein AB1405_03740 [Bdellovibrionota bacterium]